MGLMGVRMAWEAVVSMAEETVGASKAAAAILEGVVVLLLEGALGELDLACQADVLVVALLEAAQMVASAEETGVAAATRTTMAAMMAVGVAMATAVVR